MPAKKPKARNDAPRAHRERAAGPPRASQPIYPTSRLLPIQSNADCFPLQKSGLVRGEDDYLRVTPRFEWPEGGLQALADRRDYGDYSDYDQIALEREQIARERTGW